jgi:hypothetical protein
MCPTLFSRIKPNMSHQYLNLNHPDEFTNVS